MQIVLFKNNLDESHICFSFKLSCTRWHASSPLTFGEIRVFLCFTYVFARRNLYSGSKIRQLASDLPHRLGIHAVQAADHCQARSSSPKGAVPSSRRSSVNSPAVLVNWGGFQAFSNTRPKALQARPPLLQKSPFHFEGQLNSILRAR